MKFKTSKLIFKSEDEAYEAFMEVAQESMPFDISEWDRDWTDDFYDWLSDNDVEIEND